jgi:hypothetical protein
MENEKVEPRRVISKKPVSMEGEIKLKKLVPKKKRKIVHQVDVNPKFEEKKSTPHKQELQEGLTINETFQARLRKPPQKSPRFEDTHKRFTNYLEKDLFMIIQHLRQNGQIESVTQIINNAVFEYLTSYFPREMIKK